MQKEQRVSPREIHHNVKESADVGMRGKGTRSHEEISRSEEWAEARG